MISAGCCHSNRHNPSSHPLQDDQASGTLTGAQALHSRDLTFQLKSCEGKLKGGSSQLGAGPTMAASLERLVLT